MQQYLDNPVWNALSTEHKHLSLGNALAKRYQPDFSPLAGLVEQSPEAYAALGDYVEALKLAVICTPDPVILPAGWKELGGGKGAQMICDKLIPCKEFDMVVLTHADVPAMKELVDLTQPGPFEKRTIDFGTYYGIKDGDKLVAMAGERTKVPGGGEISAVCTHPDFQGRGYARALVNAVAKNLIAAGLQPYLHVRAENAAGIHTYQSIGFKIRRELYFTGIAQKSD
ncbi:GNAT family N-acetyltransferase [soil metagenome]